MMRFGRYDTLWYDTLRLGTLCYDMIWHGTGGMVVCYVLYDTAQYGWYGGMLCNIRYNMARYGCYVMYYTVRYVQYEMIRYDTIWFDMVCYLCYVIYSLHSFIYTYQMTDDSHAMTTV